MPALIRHASVRGIATSPNRRWSARAFICTIAPTTLLGFVFAFAALHSSAASLSLLPYPIGAKNSDDCVSVGDRNARSIQEWSNQAHSEVDRTYSPGSSVWSREYTRLTNEASRLADDNIQRWNLCYADVNRWRQYQEEQRRQASEQDRLARQQASEAQARQNQARTLANTNVNKTYEAAKQTYNDAIRKQTETDLHRNAAPILSSVTDGDQRRRDLANVTADLSRLYQELQNNPRPGNGGVVASNSEQALSSRDENDLLAFAGDALERALETSVKALDTDIRNASRYLSGRQLNAYRAEARDTKAVLGGLGKMVSKLDYAILAADVAKAETGVQRGEAYGEMALQFIKDMSKYGVKEVFPQLFGPKVLAVLEGPVGWTASIVFDSERIGYEYPDIIRDSSGRFSLNQKQAALAQMWRQYDRFGHAWGAGQKTELRVLSDIVYRESRQSVAITPP